jgi:hypothetical protein
MKIEIFDDSSWYAIDYRDNREQPEAEQMAALILPMTHQELRRVEEQAGTVRGKGKRNLIREYNRTRESILLRCVKEVRGVVLSSHRDGITVERSVTDPAEFVTTIAPEEVLADLMEAIRDHSHLAAGLVGKFGSPSSSRPRVTGPAVGGAPSADESTKQAAPSGVAIRNERPGDVTSQARPSGSNGLPISLGAPGLS